LLGLLAGALAWTLPAAAADVRWTPAGVQQLGDADRAVWSIDSAPGHPNILLLATSGHGVLRSTDRGATWTTAIPKTDAWLVRFDPDHAGVAYAGTASAGLFKSVDGGVTWNPANQGLTDLDVRAIALNKDLLLVGTSHGVFSSRDGAATWQSLGLADLNIAAVAILPTAKGLTLMAGADNGVSTGGGYLFRSQDLSASWSSVHLPGDPGVVASIGVGALPASSSDRPVVVGTAGGLFRSDDGVTTWTQVGGLPETDFNLVLFNPANPEQLYVASDGDLGAGGVFRSLDRGSTWSPLGFGLPSHPRVTALALQPAAPLTVFAATWNPTTQQVGLYHIPDPDATSGSTQVAPKPAIAAATPPAASAAPRTAVTPAAAPSVSLAARLALAAGAVVLVIIAVAVVGARRFRSS
jgi:hypothetical protein